ncbi:hypothetical protein SDC9_202921 [bioreactor metagenome]|uniref:Uncharacterized protein n=1 Tax=bioreactor metagenome TaxID=1076179 RepID=A0A645IV82_9ZZZZ
MADLFEVGRTSRCPGTFPRRRQRGQQDGGQNGDDGNYDQKLDQCECFRPEPDMVKTLAFHEDVPFIGFLCTNRVRSIRGENPDGVRKDNHVRSYAAALPLHGG